MKYFFKIIVLTSALALFFCADLSAQTGGFAGAYSRMVFGPRGIATGNTMATVSEQGIFSYYNPAIASQTQHTSVDFSSGLLAFGRQLNAVSASFHLPPSAGLQLGLLNANVSNIDGRTQSGYHTGYMSTHETQIFASFGLNVSSTVSLGISVKGLLANLHEEIPNSSGAAFDIGFLVRPNESLSLGFSIHDIIAEYRWDSSSLYGTQAGTTKNESFPVRYKFDASYRFFNQPLILSGGYEIMSTKANVVSNTVTAGYPVRLVRQSDEVQHLNHILRLGSIYKAHERITVRAGFEVLDLEEFSDSFRPSLGFSVHLPFDRFSPAIDYAVVREQTGIALMHIFAIRLEI